MGYAWVITLLGVAGVLVSGYALDVEHKLKSPSYKPACDMAWGSCSTVFTSAYAHPLSLWGLVPRGSDLDFGLAFMGLLNYSVYVVYPTRLFRLLPQPHLILFAMSLGGILFSCYLLYVLKFILGDFCIVCATFHAINFSMFLFGALPEYRNPTIHQVSPKFKKVE